MHESHILEPFFFLLLNLPKSKSRIGERFVHSRIPCPPCFYILLSHVLLVCVCAQGGEAYLACYHFLNDLCFQPMMDYIALIDINFPEPGKKKKNSFTHRKSMLLQG